MKKRADGPPWLSDAVPLAAVLAMRATMQSYALLHGAGINSFSADSADRVMIALSWSRHPTFFIEPAAWLPLFFWVYGAFLRLWPDPGWAPSVLTMILGNLALAPLYGICRRIGGGREGSLLAVCVAGFMPLSLFSSGQPHFDPLFTLILASAVFCWLKSDDGKNRDWHGASVLLMSAAGATRFEGWLFIGAWLLLTLRRPGLRLRLFALTPIAVCLLHQAVKYGQFQFLNLLRDRGIIIQSVHEWAVVGSLWKWVFAEGLLVPFLLLAFPALDLRKTAVRDLLGLAWLPFLAFTLMTMFMGFPLPVAHLAPFLTLQAASLAPLAERALGAWGASLREWSPSWDRPARLILVLDLALAAAIGGMMRAEAPLPPILAPTRLIDGLRGRLATDEGFLLELPREGSEAKYADERFDDPQILRVAAFPRELRFDRPFRYTHDATQGTFSLDTSKPSLLDLPQAALGTELERLSVRLILARTERRSLEKLGWKPAGPFRHYFFYTRAGDALYPAVLREIEGQRARNRMKG